MNSRTRSTIGALTMLAILPILAGLLACMPVPIGDPERSRIDPDINGVWVMHDGDCAIYAFEPYDKRSWLVTGMIIEVGPDFDGEPPNLDSEEECMQALDASDIGDDGMTAGVTSIYKAWLKKIGGVTFMTWEEVGGFDDEGSFKPEYWWVFKVVKASPDRFDLHIISPDHEGFDHLVRPDDYEGDDYVRDMRRKWERALKKVAKDEELYDDGIVMMRVPDEYLYAASKLFREVLSYGD